MNTSNIELEKRITDAFEEFFVSPTISVFNVRVRARELVLELMSNNLANWSREANRKWKKDKLQSESCFYLSNFTVTANFSVAGTNYRIVGETAGVVIVILSVTGPSQNWTYSKPAHTLFRIISQGSLPVITPALFVEKGTRTNIKTKQLMYVINDYAYYRKHKWTTVPSTVRRRVKQENHLVCVNIRNYRGRFTFYLECDRGSGFIIVHTVVRH
jgi:hypothetical protein